MFGLALRGRPGARATLAFVLAALAMLVLPLAARASAVTALSGCDTALDAGDDNSSDAVPIGFPVNLNDTTYNDLYVNNNGSVTFDDALGEYTPYDFTITGEKIIAPFLADVDTTGANGGEVTYGQTTFDGRDAFCVTWSNVGYYNSHDDKTNTFQLILVKRATAGDVDVVFNYDKVQWETGDASDGENGFGGSSAAVGYSAGDGDPANSLVLSGSFSPGSFLDSNPDGLIHHQQAAAIATTGGRYTYHLTAPTGPKVTGTVHQHGSTDPESGAVVEFCRQSSSDPCITRTANQDGEYTVRGLVSGATYNVRALPGPGSNATPGPHAPIAFTGSDMTAQDIEMGDPPPPPPPGTEITNIGTNPDGIPVAFWED